MKKRIIVIVVIAVILCVTIWYNTPFSYSFDEDVEFNMSYADTLIIIDSREQREALIKLVENLEIKRSISQVGNVQSSDYISFRANDASHPYLGFHLSRQDISVKDGAPYLWQLQALRAAVSCPSVPSLYILQHTHPPENGIIVSNGQSDASK